MTSSIPFKTFDLFGGAITIKMPENLIDVSTIRQVPDAQEVFISPTTSATTTPTITTSTSTTTTTGTSSSSTSPTSTILNSLNNLSIIIEVLESVDPKSDSDYQLLKTNNNNDNPINDDDLPTSIIKYHFDSLAHDNSASSSTIRKIDLPGSLDYFTSELVPTSTPEPLLLHGLQTVSKFNRSPSEADTVYIWMALWRLNGIGSAGTGTDLVLTLNLPQLASDPAPPDQAQLDHAAQLFRTAANSLTIVDWFLFA